MIEGSERKGKLVVSAAFGFEQGSKERVLTRDVTHLVVLSNNLSSLEAGQVALGFSSRVVPPRDPEASTSIIGLAGCYRNGMRNQPRARCESLDNETRFSMRRGEGEGTNCCS
jgi:hypothetical protein